MARISIEESWFTDPRREFLRRKIGDAADYAALMLWRTARKV